MIGKFLAKAIKVATLPVDAVNAGFDILTGGDGSKRSRNHPDNCCPTVLLEQVRDAVADAAQAIDEDE